SVEDILTKASCRAEGTKPLKTKLVKEVELPLVASEAKAAQMKLYQKTPESLLPKIKKMESFEAFVARRTKSLQAVFKASSD
ncbi:hypothetical protein, partial [Alteromonas stellipolaris]|uniref:hypothetical protein n=1 Tax=Alteromonas stellipolaris TaxID=233316 RepID=UPI001D375C8D